MEDTLAKLSVSARLFDYILTGPISAVTAGQYFSGFIQEVAYYLKHPLHFNENYFARRVWHFCHPLLLVEEHRGNS
jgi:hypothetical protein